MPEGHSIHRTAARFTDLMVGRAVRVTSPQGRFSAGAALLDHRELEAAFAVGKQLFLEFAGQSYLRVHLGLYGAWDFATLHGGTGAIGAPRKNRGKVVTRLRAGEQESRARQDGLDGEAAAWPPAPVGAVRARLLTDDACVDLRGPTACEVLDSGELAARLEKLGPDPLVDGRARGRRRFIAKASGKRTPIGQVLMDQAVVAGIGNIYRAELLFRGRVDPHTPTNRLPEETLAGLWDDWCKLLPIGVATGVIVTRTHLRGQKKQAALESVEGRHAVYGRAGKPCYRCPAAIACEEMAGRKLYWCPGCQTE